MSTVAVTHVDSYDAALMDAAVARQFELLELEGKINPSSKIVIKPNLLMKRKPEEFTTTNPVLIASIVKQLQSMGCRDIMLAESPGGPYTSVYLKSIYSGCGITQMAQQVGLSLNTEVGYRAVANAMGRTCKEFNIIDPIAQADVVISVAKLKTHSMTGLSGAVKNLFGCVPGLMKPEFHWRFPDKRQFCDMLVDLCETVKPTITFVDAIDSMEGDGPSGGTKKHTGMLIAGCDPYSIDMALCAVIGADTDTIYTVVNAIERGLCPKTINEVQLVGDPLKIYDDFQKPVAHTIDFSSHTPRFVRKIARFVMQTWLTPKPKIQTAHCIGCGKCAESCPAQTIALVATSGLGKKAIIRYDKCIKCYCCHEMCPVKAIEIKRFGLLKR